MTKQVQKLDHVIIRFAGDSGDGMQLAGDRFTQETAVFGNDLSTMPNFPAEIRAPAGTLAGVSSFQLQFADHDILTPGDAPDVLIAMNPAALKANIKDLPRGGVHRDQDIRRVARREDVMIGEMQLEARYAGQGAGRGPDFRREIRLGGQVVAEDRRLLGEPVSSELHAVTGVAGEPDDDVIELLDLLGHSWKTSSACRGRTLTQHHPTAGGMS